MQTHELFSNRPSGEHFSVAIIGGKHRENLGQIMRLVINFGASSVYLVNCKYTRTVADTMNTPKSIPVVECEELPHIVGATHVYLEMGPDAVPLPLYNHPRRALYIVGPENGSVVVPEDADCVEVETLGPMNQSQAMAVLLYDRAAKTMVAGKS